MNSYKLGGGNLYIDNYDGPNAFFGAIGGEGSSSIPHSGKGIADGVNGTLPAVSWTGPGYDDSSWPTIGLAMYSSDYIYPGPGNWPSAPAGAYQVPAGAGTSGGHWGFRATVDFPSSGDSLAGLAGTPYEGFTIQADPGEMLYALYLWTDNDGTLYVDGNAMASASGTTNYTTTYILSATQGPHLLAIDKTGDRSTDGLSVKIATVGISNTLAGSMTRIGANFKPKALLHARLQSGGGAF